MDLSIRWADVTNFKPQAPKWKVFELSPARNLGQPRKHGHDYVYERLRCRNDLQVSRCRCEVHSGYQRLHALPRLLASINWNTFSDAEIAIGRECWRSLACNVVCLGIDKPFHHRRVYWLWLYLDPAILQSLPWLISSPSPPSQTCEPSTAFENDAKVAVVGGKSEGAE